MVFVDELQDYGIDVKESYKDGLFVVDIYTNWCGPCKFLSPILEHLSEEDLFELIEIDLDQNRPLGQRFGITAIPTVLFFNHGKMLEGTIEVDGQALVNNGIMIGAAAEPTIRKIIEKI